MSPEECLNALEQALLASVAIPPLAQVFKGLEFGKKMTKVRLAGDGDFWLFSAPVT